MNGLIIQIRVVLVALIVYKTAKTKKTKYLLTPSISILYGVMLFFIGISISTVLFYVLATVPIIIFVVNIAKQKYR
jgi:hypothetical protein